MTCAKNDVPDYPMTVSDRIRHVRQNILYVETTAGARAHNTQTSRSAPIMARTTARPLAAQGLQHVRPPPPPDHAAQPSAASTNPSAPSSQPSAARASSVFARSASANVLANASSSAAAGDAQGRAPVDWKWITK